MDPQHRPPKERGSRAQLREPLRVLNQTDSSASVQQVRIFYNRLVEVRRCLTEDWWEWLAWTAASGTGYTPREFVTIDVLKGGMIYGAR